MDARRAMRSLVLPALVLAHLPASAQEAMSLEPIAAGYFSAGSYCDAGRRGWRDDPRRPFTQELAFERCASRDGRFRYVETDARTGATVKWSDARRFYHYIEWGRRYQDLSLDDPFTFDLYRNRGEIFPVFVFELFSGDPRRLTDPAERARYLRSYALNPALSTPQLTVFERSDANANSGERLWVRNADRSIVRHERLSDGGVVRFAEISSRQLNRPLTQADLWYDVPLFARYSLMNNPGVFFAALIVAAALAGALFWVWLFTRAAGVEAALRKRRFLWRLQRWAFGVTGVILALLAAMTAGGGGGHPPAIVIVWVLALWSAVIFAMTACFTLASYPIELLFKTVQKGGGHGG